MPVDNPIHGILDAIGLPWRSSRAELLARYGTGQDIMGSEIIPIRTRPPLVTGLLGPLEVRALPGLAPDLPALELSGDVSHGRDVRVNIGRAAADLHPALGRAEVRKQYNTLVCGWAYGRASVRLVAFPPEWQAPLGNVIHKRDPRRITSCSVTVDTGFRLSATEQELRWIGSFEPLPGLRRHQAPVRSREGMLELLRDVVPSAPMRGRVGWSAGHEALIFCDDELHLIPADSIDGFALERMLPAKGPGWSTLYVICRTRRRPWTSSRINLADASGADDLTAAGVALGETVGKPCEIGAYDYDC